MTAATKPKRKRKPAGVKAAATRPAARPETVEAANLDPKLIDPSPYQPRQDFPVEEIKQLAESIAGVGLLQPVIVRVKRGAGRYELVDGERRLWAVKKLKLPTIRAEIQEHTDAQVRAIVLVSALQRKDLNAIEEAIAFKAAIDAGDAAGPTELAEQISVSQGHVSNRLRLLGLPEPVQKRIISHEIPPTHARCLLPLKDHPKLISKVLERVVVDGDAGTVVGFADEVDYTADAYTMPMTTKRYDSKLKGAKSVFKPTGEQREKLGLITVEGFNSKPEERATNVKLWEKLQAAHVASLAEKQAGRKAPANGKPAGKARPLTPAQQKAAAAEEKRKATERAALFRKRLYEWKIDWLRYLIYRGLVECDADTVTRVLLYLAACPEPWGVLSGVGSTARMGDRERNLVGHIGGCGTSVPKRATLHGRHDELAGLAELDNSDAGAYVARNFAASCFWDANAGQADPQVPAHDVETLAEFLCIDLAAAWKAEQAGSLSEAYWNLHNKDQLGELAKELDVRFQLGWPKPHIVKALLSATKLPLPKEILKVKRPR